MNKKYAVLSLSGGMDSSTLLLHLLNEGYDCTCLSFDYGQKHKVELERATELVEYINNKKINIPVIKHQIIKLDGLAQLLNSSLVEGGAEVPEGHYAEENMKDTVVPNRNKIFSSIIQAVALSIATKNNAKCAIAMGIHAGDHSVYPDCRKEFRDADYFAFLEGNWDADCVFIHTPYLNTDKFGILEDGAKCCELLGLDFDEVYYRTNTSYKPIWIPTEGITDNSKKDKLYGNWYSDYKSASSVERVEAFIKLGRPDPCAYADEFGPVTWEHVVSYVCLVIENHEKETSNR
jgi:7-cyano-7-deazaguanine synthase